MVFDQDALEQLYADLQNNVIIDGRGITARDKATLLENAQKWFKIIYNNDNVDFNSNTFEGQIVFLATQVLYSSTEKLINLANQLNLQTARGKFLDDQVALSGQAPRLEDAFTQVDVEIVTNVANVRLQGLDTDYPNENATAFGVQDNSGNLFYLINSVTIPNAGTSTLRFRASQLGATLVSANVITNITTPVGGVVSCNNPNSEIVVGRFEETDEDLRARAIATQKIAPNVITLVNAINSVDKVNDSLILVNNTHAVDANGLLPNSVWVIVDGGSDADIANAIANNNAAGIQTNGAVSVPIYIPGQALVVYVAHFDRSDPVPLFVHIKTNIALTSGALTSVAGAIENANLLKINQSATKGSLFNFIYNYFEQNNINVVLLDVKLGTASNDINYDIVNPATPKVRFNISAINVSNSV